MALHTFAFMCAFHYMVAVGRFLLACEECAYSLSQNGACVLQRNRNTLVRDTLESLRRFI